jgi:hypothetical protein
LVNGSSIRPGILVPLVSILATILMSFAVISEK